MKLIVVTLSGAADHPVSELGGKTPFEVAKIPHLNYFTKIGKLGLVKLVPDRLEPLADNTFLNLLGYDADTVYTGRGPLEAANLELKLEDNEIPFRMNFITEYNGKLSDPTAGRLGTKEAKALINFLNKKLASDFVRFFAGNEYRHVAVIKDSHGFEALSAKTVSPESIMGESMDLHFPKGPGEELLKKLMYDGKLLLQDHEINQVRVDLNENPANMLWLWGQGKRPALEKFSEKFGLSAALIARMEFVMGIGRLAGLTVFEVADKMPNMDANYEKKGRVLIDALAEKDFVCCHISSAEEASGEGNLRAKISAIEATDFFILSKVREYLDKNKDTRLLVTTQHATPLKIRRPVRDFVPFVMAGRNIMPDEVEKFSELAAKSSEFKLGKGNELMTFFLQNK